MSSTTQTLPVVTLYPSVIAKEDVNAYMAAIRLASSVRNSMDAQKAAVDDEKVAVNADSYGRHHPNSPPSPSAKLAPVPILNQTSSANVTSNTTKPGFVHPRDRYPSSGRYMITANTSTSATLQALRQHHGHLPPPDSPMSTGPDPILEDAAAGTPAGVKPQALEQHHGDFPPPEPPTGSTQRGAGNSMSTGPGPIIIEADHSHMLVPNSTTTLVNPPTGSTPAPPGTPISKRTGPIPIHPSNGPSGMKLYIPGETPPQCQLYVTNTDLNNTFAVCPVTKRAAHNLASRQLRPGHVSTSHFWTIRDTAMCDKPTGFDKRLACGRYDGWFALAFFLLFAMVGVAWMRKRNYGVGNVDVEGGIATRSRLENASTHGSEAKSKSKSTSHPQAERVSTKTSEAKLREKVRKAHDEMRETVRRAHEEEERRSRGEIGAEEYEAVAWRGASRRAERAVVEGWVGHDAGPVAVLPPGEIAGMSV